MKSRKVTVRKVGLGKEKEGRTTGEVGVEDM